MTRKVGFKSKEDRYDEAAAEHARQKLREFAKDFPTQDDAAARLGYTQPQISRVIGENATGQPSLRMMLALHRVTGESLDSLFGVERAEITAVRRLTPKLLDAVDLVDALRELARVTKNPR